MNKKPYFHCPKCNSKDIEAGRFEYDGEGDTVEQDIMCTSCDFEWTELYKFVRAVDVDNNEI